MFSRILTALCGALALGVAVQASAATGPVYPPPGGVTFSTNGVSPRQSGRVATYQNFDLSATDELYFALTATGLAMDGAINEPGEAMTFNAALSNLANGIVVFSGATQVNSFGSDLTVYNLLTLSFADLATNNPLALILDPTIATNPLLSVAGGFTMSGGFTSSWTAVGGYSASQTFFDAVQGKSQAFPQLVTDFGGGFYFTEVSAVPEPGTWGMMLLGFGVIGFAVRRSRKQVLLRQIA